MNREIALIILETVGYSREQAIAYLNKHGVRNLCLIVNETTGDHAATLDTFVEAISSLSYWPPCCVCLSPAGRKELEGLAVPITKDHRYYCHDHFLIDTVPNNERDVKENKVSSGSAWGTCDTCGRKANTKIKLPHSYDGTHEFIGYCYWHHPSCGHKEDGGRCFRLATNQRHGVAVGEDDIVYRCNDHTGEVEHVGGEFVDSRPPMMDESALQVGVDPAEAGTDFTAETTYDNVLMAQAGEEFKIKGSASIGTCDLEGCDENAIWIVDFDVSSVSVDLNGVETVSGNSRSIRCKAHHTTTCYLCRGHAVVISNGGLALCAVHYEPPYPGLDSLIGSGQNEGRWKRNGRWQDDGYRTYATQKMDEVTKAVADIQCRLEVLETGIVGLQAPAVAIREFMKLMEEVVNDEEEIKS